MLVYILLFDKFDIISFILFVELKGVRSKANKTFFS